MKTFKKGKFEIKENSSIIFEAKGKTLCTTVNASCGGSFYYLWIQSYKNDEIFELLGIGRSHKVDWIEKHISCECDGEGTFPEIETFEDFGKVIYELASMCDNVVVDGIMFAKESFKKTDSTSITIRIHSTRTRVNLH